MRTEAKRAYDAAYYRRHKEQIKECVRKRWRSDPNAKLLDKACRDRHREKIRAYDRMRAKRDRVKKKIIIARWIANNLERHRAKCRERARRYYARKRAA